ncbi:MULTISPECIES: glycosyltransferase [Oceanobacillus]|uniref:glycosyltransferase n=1 Tax=Oceanobacillus TaxID=182709 RepID=UPI000345BFE1|nr:MULTISPECIES: glycosyltransferase [Oceanobacillus]MBT2600526.1 glycosyltransferase [Oceanobacillus sp. ISL-74]MBT2650684.1 glycosyltransferase [Oceanobacillus sp. ISL-73]
MNPSITVLMSVYNDGEYLEKSIESILNQTYTDFEFLIYDDLSSDCSRNILEKYAKQDDRIKLILNSTNKGLSYNLARGVSKAKAPIIARMDADDIAFSNRLEVQMKEFKEDPSLDLLGSYVKDIDDKGNEIEIRKVPLSKERINKLIWACPFIHPTVIFKKKAIEMVGSYNPTLRKRQDYDLWFRCKAHGLNYKNINKPLLYYRFTDSYYKKNNYKVQFDQAVMGYKGCVISKASPIAYIGITFTLIKGVLPIKIRKPLTELTRKIDPRRN